MKAKSFDMRLIWSELWVEVGIAEVSKVCLKHSPVLKLTTMSMRKMVSETQLKITHLMERSSLKKEIATGRMIRLATRSNSMHRSQ